MDYSYIITSLDSALKYARILSRIQDKHGDEYSAGPYVLSSVKTGIRSLKSLLICLGRLDERIYPGLESYVRDINEIQPIVSSTRCWSLMYEVSPENCQTLYGAWKCVLAAEDELYSNGGIQLGADELISIIICVMGNISDFLGILQRISSVPKNAFQVLEAFDVQMRFIKHLLRFTMQASAEDLLLLHIQPIAVKAAAMFSQGTIASFEKINSDFRRHFLDPELHYLAWYKEVESKCSALNLMAASPPVWQAYARALTAIRHAPITPPTAAADDEEEDEEEEERYYHWAGNDDDDEEVDGEEEQKDDDDEEEGLYQWALGDSDDDSEEEDILKALLDSFISLLWDILRRQSESRVKDQYKLIYEKLRFSRAIWKKKRTDKNRRHQIGVLICDAGSFIFLLQQTQDPARFDDVLERFDVFHAQFQLQTIPSSKIDSTSIKVPDDGNGWDLDYSSTSNHQQPQVVGFKEEELQLLLDRLTGGSKELCIVPICGMAGLGKTTLALKLYNHPLMEHFQARAWCPVSQVPDKKKVLVQLLNQIRPDDYFRKTEDDLANILRQSLKGRRYLIFLDDVWSARAWDSFKASFPNDFTSSRVILTSRCLDIVPRDQHPHLLRLRSVSECFEILHKKLSHKESWDTELVMQIAEKCNGLPLTVTLVAGLLATSKQGSCKGILDHLSSGGVSGGAESAMELSYRYLPDYLQPCFLYFGAFLEDEEVSVKWLIQLWMAEGFVKKRDQSRRIEDVAREYVEKLIERNLIMPVQSRSLGGVKSCRIHDVVHDFCRSKAKQENLFHLLLQSQDQLSDFNEPHSLQRLFVYSTTTHFVESRLFCPRAQTLLFFTAGEEFAPYMRDISFTIQVFHMLKVLDLYQFFFKSDIPSDIGLLTKLRYLRITAIGSVIPSSLGNLSSLETFIANMGDDDRESTLVSFPDTLWNLQKLRYLRISGCCCTLPVENLDNSPTLSDLETLDGVCFYSDDGSMEKQLKKFPNLRTFKCRILEGERFAEKFPKIVIPEFLSQLEVLSVRADEEAEFELGSSAENLIKLKLEGVEMSREDVAVIGKYPNLEVLILSEILYLGNTLEMEEEEFVKLRILKLISSESLERWTCSDDQASCLEKLVIKYCSNLEEIPSLFGDISTLEHISVVGCSSTLESAGRIIEEAQKGWGNCVQVNIEPSKY